MKAKTISEIRKEGLEVLAKNLGPPGTVSFVQSFDLGRGDFAKEGSQWLPESLVSKISFSLSFGFKN